MLKSAFSTFLLLVAIVSNAQNNKRIKGQFTGKNLDKSFINVINLNQAKATISQLDGKFEIEAKLGDSILISSIQYKEIKFEVKSEYFGDNLEIPLKLMVNELEQVNLYSIGLSGNLETDAKNITTTEPLALNFGSFDVSKVYDEEVTTQSEFTLRNVALEQNQIPSSVDFLGVFRLVGKLFGKKEKQGKFSKPKPTKSNKLNDLDFFIDFLKIEEENIGDFMAYAKVNGLTKEMLKKENELDLIQFLIDISENFKAENGK
jgi:hypothetical protein